MAAEIVALTSEDISFGQADCTSYQSMLLCLAMNIEYYPTILIFSKHDLSSL
jgi:hypothetical protein